MKYKVAFVILLFVKLGLGSGCSNFQFKCNDGTCIRSHYRCDMDIDCLEGDDEENCAETICEEDEFRCLSGRCIPKHYVCDGDMDCVPRGEDEAICRDRTPTPKTDKTKTNNSSSETELTDDIIVRNPSDICEEGKFRCRNGNCVTGSYRCDGDRDCTDGSDEADCNLCLKPSTIQCSVMFRKGGIRDFNSWKCVENNTFRISPARLIPRTQGSFDDPTVAYLKIVCESSFEMDFKFKGVDSLEIFDVSQNKKDEKYIITVHSVLAPHTTGRYIFLDINNPSTVNEFFIFVEKETKPYLLGRQRNLNIEVGESEDGNATSIVLPCVSSKLNVPIYLFRREMNGSYIRMENDSSTGHYQYDSKRGFVLTTQTIIQVFDLLNSTNGTVEFLCTTDPRNSNDIDVAQILIPLIVIDKWEHNVNTTNGSNSTDTEPGLKIVFDSKSHLGATCHSVPYNSTISTALPLKFTNMYAKNPIEANLLIDCESKGFQNCGTRSKIQQHNPTKDYVTCKYGSQLSNCQHLSEIYDQGVLVCQSGTNVVSKTYFIGLDGIPYSDNEWDTVSDSAILRVEANFKTNEILSETDYHVKCPGIDMILNRSPIIEVGYNDNTTQKKTTYASSAFVSLKVGATDISCFDSVWKSNRTVNANLHLNVTVKPKPCSYLQFTCDSGQCIRYSYRCDRDRDCTDNSDERNCTYATTTTTTPVPCSSTEFKCNSGVCIRGSYRCDGDRDCMDGLDEIDCPTTTPRPVISTTQAGLCSYGLFACKNGDCIRIHYMCDNEKDCKDASDEDPVLCANRTTTTTPSSTTLNPTIASTTVSNTSISTINSTIVPSVTSTTQKIPEILVDDDHTEIFPEIIVRQHKISGKDKEVTTTTSGGVIAGIIVGVLLVILIVAGLILAYYKYLSGPGRRGNHSSGTNIKYTNPLFDSDTTVTLT